MSKGTDQQYLLQQQYADSANLDARVRLHSLFSENKQGWNRWVWEQFRFPEQARILELGCGPAYLWRENADRIPSGWEVMLSDFSKGMVDAARARLGDVPHAFQFAQIDAQFLPFPDGWFDGVIANHMLYHVPDRFKAIKEMQRVLKVGGARLCLHYR